MDKTPNKYWILCICLALTLATLVSFWQVRNCSFVNYDDNIYVTNNHYVKAGLTQRSVLWAFTTGYMANWHPLTWLSHMLDCELFGANPGFHHLTNLLLHLINTLLLFAVLKRMTGALWRSAFVAAAFALHPLHVESVAWVSERKDVLSALFWMLTIAAYLSYVRRPTTGRYMITLLVFAFGLMAKPMLVTLPFVLLLLDYWPLGRLQFGRDVGYGSLYRLVTEKIPLFALSAISSIVTFVVQQKGGAVSKIDLIPVLPRISNAFISYVKYVEKMFCPGRLAVLYPYPPQPELVSSAAAALVLLAISILMVRLASKHRYLLVGWLWYLGTLVPVIGLVQVGSQALADRYTYLPLTGLFIIIAWGLPDLLAKGQYRKIALGTSAVVVLLALVVCTHLQLRHWRNSIALFEHAIDVTEDNYVAHCSLAYSLQEQGKLDQAIAHSYEALRIRPDFTKAYLNLGLALTKKGNLDHAIAQFTKTLQLDPNFTLAHYRFAQALAQKGKINEAIAHLREALRLRPDWVDAMNNLAWFLAAYEDADLHNPQQAIQLAERTCELTDYSWPDSLDTLAVAYAAAGRFSEAVTTAEKALQLTQSSEQNQLTEQIQNRLSLYKAQQPYLESSPKTSHN